MAAAIDLNLSNLSHLKIKLKIQDKISTRQQQLGISEVKKLLTGALNITLATLFCESGR